MKYTFLISDNPWKYASWNLEMDLPTTRQHKMRGNGMATAIYKGGVMTIERLIEMGPFVQSICEDNAALVLWVTNPHTFYAPIVAKAWGFPHYSSKIFTWVKTYGNLHVPEDDEQMPENNKVYVGMGRWSRQSTEDAYLFLRGKNPPGRMKDAKNVRQVWVGPVAEHSEKPVIFNERYERLCGPGNYLDMFARRYKRGAPECLWTCIGDELDNLDIFDSLAELAALELNYVPMGLRKINGVYRRADSVKPADKILHPHREGVQLPIF